MHVNRIVAFAMACALVLASPGTALALTEAGTSVARAASAAVSTSGSTGGSSTRTAASTAATKYKITYKLNGGTLAKGSPTVYTSGKGTSLKSPARSGYVFKGWYSDSKLTKKVSSISKTSKGNITLYAKWARTYKIGYYVNGGKLASGSPRSYTYGTGAKLKSPSRSGYTFKGWYTSSRYTKRVTSISSKATGNVTLYAKWEKKTSSKSSTVYITKSGSCYHRSTCSTIKRSKGVTKLSSSTARSRGYRACKVCKP